MAGTEGQDDVELDVWDPELRLDRGKADDGEEYRDLYMQTFVRDSTEPHQWRSQPESRWHHLARVHPKKSSPTRYFPILTHNGIYLAGTGGSKRSRTNSMSSTRCQAT